MSRVRSVWLGAFVAISWTGSALSAERPFHIFFDWSESMVTPAASKTLALFKSQLGTHSRIKVVGHTDTSERAQVARERAAAVKTELVALGVPSKSISTSGVGARAPLVPTDPNVREPQNRVVDVSAN